MELAIVVGEGEISAAILQLYIQVGSGNSRVGVVCCKPLPFYTLVMYISSNVSIAAPPYALTPTEWGGCIGTPPHQESSLCVLCAHYCVDGTIFSL